MKRVKVYIDRGTFRINGMNDNEDNEDIFVDERAWDKTHNKNSSIWKKFYVDLLTPEVFWKGTACPSDIEERAKAQFTAHSAAFFLRFASN